ncbi:MAG TPA: hypothetical protein VFT93_01615, partial [Candidatus Eisenbacteria bacterium]|nr:hypothetical protein [Candidatus Eisenbacteria bacterium]
MIRRALLLCALAAVGPLLAAPARAQMHHHAMPSDSTAAKRHAMPADSMASMPMDDAMAMDHAGHMGHGGMEMEAMYGSYPMTREASGTSWQPDAARHQGLHAMRGAWMLMLHGFADLVVDDQGG